MSSLPTFSDEARSVRRSESRLRVRQGAKVITLGGAKGAVLLDVAQRGARIATDLPLRPGNELVLQWLDFEAFGRVIWAGDGEYGIALYDELPPKVLYATRDRDDSARLPSEREQQRLSARKFVSGRF